jgi:hypothetical protein
MTTIIVEKGGYADCEKGLARYDQSLCPVYHHGGGGMLQLLL